MSNRCIKHNYLIESFASCPLCTQEEHNSKIEKQNEKLRLEVERQTKIQESIADAQYREIEAQALHRKAENYQHCVSVVSDLLPQIHDKYGTTFIVGNYLRLSRGLEHYSGQSMDPILRGLISEDSDTVALKIIDTSEALVLAVSTLYENIPIERESEYAWLKKAEAARIDNTNNSCYLILLGVLAFVLVWLYLNHGFGVTWGIFSFVAFLVMHVIYKFLFKIEAEFVTRKPYEFYFRRHDQNLKSLRLYSSEDEDGVSLAEALFDGPIPVFALLSKWAKEERKSILKELKQEVSIAKKLLRQQGVIAERV
jgi:hypothetical protein